MPQVRALRVLVQADSLLRGTLEPGHAWWVGPRLVLMFAPVAGLAIGSFSVSSPDRAWFMVFAAIKLPMLILLSAALCLPGYFVIHVALGRRHDFAASVRGVLGSQAMFALVLAALAPVIPVWYSAANSHQAALVGVGLLFAMVCTVSVAGMVRSLRRAGLDQPVHRVLAIVWLGLYSLVATQLAWVLRPFVGTPGTPVQFFRDEAFTNGYVVVFRLVFGG